METLTLDIYPDEGGSAEGTLYEDDGATHAYEAGESRLMHFHYQSRQRRLGVQIEGGFQSPVKSLQIRLHSPPRDAWIDSLPSTTAWEIEV